MTDLLVFSPHPDDAEIHCGATMAAHVRQGATVVLVDATRGELASRGTPEIRAREASAASEILGLSGRESLGLRDGHLDASDMTARLAIVDCLRRYRPSTVLCLHGHARHPDHIALAALVSGAIKAAALHGLATGTAAHSGMRLWCYEAELRIDPDVLVPVTAEDWSRKIAAIRCYGSQLHVPGDDLPATSIARPDFLDWIEDRGRQWGREADAPYAEAYTRVHDVPRARDLRLI